jgi:hypothetical protein
MPRTPHSSLNSAQPSPRRVPPLQSSTRGRRGAGLVGVATRQLAGEPGERVPRANASTFCDRRPRRGRSAAAPGRRAPSIRHVEQQHQPPEALARGGVALAGSARRRCAARGARCGGGRAPATSDRGSDPARRDARGEPTRRRWPSAPGPRPARRVVVGGEVLVAQHLGGENRTCTWGRRRRRRRRRRVGVVGRRPRSCHSGSPASSSAPSERDPRRTRRRRGRRCDVLGPTHERGRPAQYTCVAESGGEASTWSSWWAAKVPRRICVDVGTAEAGLATARTLRRRRRGGGSAGGERSVARSGARSIACCTRSSSRDRAPRPSRSSRPRPAACRARPRSASTAAATWRARRSPTPGHAQPTMATSRSKSGCSTQW